MIGLIILCVLVLAAAMLLIMPTRARFFYNQGDFTACLCYGPVKLQLYPLKEKPKSEKKAEKKKKPTQGETREAHAKISKEQILYSLETLPPILGRALRHTGQRVRLEPLKLHLLVASPDPADTALLFGKLEAALAAGLPVLHRLVRIKDQDIQLFPDFTEERIDCIADVGIAIRPLDVLAIVLPTGASLIKWLLRFKKLAPPIADAPQKKTFRQDAMTEAV